MHMCIALQITVRHGVTGDMEVGVSVSSWHRSPFLPDRGVGSGGRGVGCVCTLQPLWGLPQDCLGWRDKHNFTLQTRESSQGIRFLSSF